MAKARNDLNFTTHEQVGAWYDNKFTEMGGSWHVPAEEINMLLDKMGYPANSIEVNLLELGCGDGKLLYEAAKRGGWCAGVDVSAVAKAMSDKRCLGLPVDVRLSPMEQLPYPAGTFHFVISYGSMEHALDIPAAVKEMSRVLVQGGRWLNLAPNEDYHWEDQPLETTMTADEWQPMYDDAGLTVESITKDGANNLYIGSKL